jgi:predicted dehydrogenase
MKENIMTHKPAKVGLVGCGNISSIYFQASQKFEAFDIVACADILVERAQARAEEYNIPKATGVDELIADPDLDIVLNLTIPQAHGPVALQALEAGKSVYNEKPLAIDRESAQRMLELAKSKGLLVGCAPDTFMGGGLQTCRKLLDDGWIGTPVAATAFMMGHGPESWHPDPNFFYQPGAGPMFDMGPYYLTALASMLGPVRRVTGSAQITFPERMITSKPKYGEMIQVNTPTHVVGVLDFQSGPVATIITSFDVWSAELPRIEIYGTQGTMSLPDPNTFGGPVRIRRAGEKEWSEVPLAYGYSENSRGLGLADMSYALMSGRPQRASGELAYHVLDIMHAIHDASREGKHIDMTSTCERPALLPLGLVPGRLDP